MGQLSANSSSTEIFYLNRHTVHVFYFLHKNMKKIFFLLGCYIERVEVSLNFKKVHDEEMINWNFVTSVVIERTVGLWVNLPDSIATLKPYFMYNCMAAT